jgi:hypothetical protein
VDTESKDETIDQGPKQERVHNASSDDICDPGANKERLVIKREKRASCEDADKVADKSPSYEDANQKGNKKQILRTRMKWRRKVGL